MKDTLIRTGVVSFAGLFAVGFLTVPNSTASTSETAVMKRDEKITLVSTVDDDDDIFGPSISRASKLSKAPVSKPSALSQSLSQSRAAAAPVSSPAPEVNRDRDVSRASVSRQASVDGADYSNDWSRHVTASGSYSRD